MFTPSVNIHTHSCCGSLCSGIAAYSSCATTSMIESAPPCRVVQTRHEDIYATTFTAPTRIEAE